MSVAREQLPDLKTLRAQTTSPAARIGLGILPVLPFVALLLTWIIVGRVLQPSRATLAVPSAVWETMWGFVTDGTLLTHVRSSFTRLAQGVSLGVVSGILLGLLAGRSKRVSDFLEPLVTFFTAISGLAWVPLAIMWFGLGGGMVTFIIWNAMFFIVLLNTMLGVRLSPPLFTDGVRTLGAGSFTVMWQVILPSALPYIISGLRTGFAFAWRGLIGAELIGASAGLGHMIYTGAEWFRSDIVLGFNILIGLFALFMDRFLLEPIETRTVQRWGMVTRAGGDR